MTNDGHDDAKQGLDSAASLGDSNPCFRVSLQDGVTHIEAVAPPAIEDIVAIGAELAHSGEHPKRLWDYSSIEFPFSIDEIKALAREAKQLNRQNARIAVVVADDVGYGSMRVLAVHFENDTTSLAIFREKNKAIDWLNEL